MQLAVIILSLIAAGLAAYFYGAWKLSRFAARISGGLAAGVLLFPPVTYWFSFHRLKEEGKEMPTSLWMFGMIITTLIIVMFWTPLTYVFTGRIAELEPPAEQMTAVVDEPTPAPTPTPAPEVAPPAENNAPTAGEEAAGATNAPTEATDGTATDGTATNNATAETGGAPEAAE